LTGVFTTLKQQLETTKIEEVKESDYVVVLDAPEMPLLPIKPRKARIVILVGILGIGLGIIIGLRREYFENLTKEEKEKLQIARTTFLENIFEMIPFISTREKL